MNHTYLYQCRFSAFEQQKRKVYWRIVYDQCLARYIRPSDTLVDIGAGTLEFLHAARANQKIAVDPIFSSRTRTGAISCYSSVNALPKKMYHTVDVVMLSNVLEHLSDRDEIMSVLSFARKLLTPKGSLLIIQPTIDLVGVKYWDFFDHITPITRASLQEALTVAGFSITVFVPRFLPYTTKTLFPVHPFFLKMYLHLPWMMRPWSGQCFVVATPKRLKDI